MHIPSDLVVKSQVVDIAQHISWLMWRPSIVYLSCKHRKARCERLSTSADYGSTTKSGGVWGFLVHDAVKDLPQRVAIAALRRRRDADHQRAIGAPGPAMVEDAAVGRGGGVVRFVNDDGVEIRHEAGEPRAATEGLHTGHHGGG